MKVTELDLPPGVAEILMQDGIEILYPPQEKAIPLALQGKNLFLAVPTASGKSLVAYLAALKHVLERGGKALYIVPLRALAAEKFEDLKRFEPLTEIIDTFWLQPEHQEAEGWVEHRDINMVMLATSLHPDGFLAV